MDATSINTVVTIFGIVITIGGIIIAIISISRKRVITVSTKTKLYVSTSSNGSFVFDYSNNNGQYVIGEGDYEFCTKWSKASNVSIYAYKDCAGIDSIALLKAPVALLNTTSIEGYFSSRCRTPKIGDAVIWKNTKGNYAITKIVSICDDTRGDKNDQLKCEYIILK